MDWRSKFSADERYSLVDFGVAKKHKPGRRRRHRQDRRGRQGFRRAKDGGIPTREDRARSGRPTRAGGARLRVEAQARRRARRGRRRRQEDATAPRRIRTLDIRTAPALRPAPAGRQLAKRIETVAGFVHTTGKSLSRLRDEAARQPSSLPSWTRAATGTRYYAWLRHAAARVGVDPKKPPGVVRRRRRRRPRRARRAARKIAEAPRRRATERRKGRGRRAGRGEDARGSVSAGGEGFGAVGRTTGTGTRRRRRGRPPTDSNRLFPDVAASASVVRMDGRCEPYHTRRRIS